MTKIFSIIAVIGFLSGCSYAPGLYVKADEFKYDGKTDDKIKENNEIPLVPITVGLLERQAFKEQKSQKNPLERKN